MRIFDLRLAVAAALVLPTAAAAEVPLRGDAARGKQLFQMECASCHGADGRGATDWAKRAAAKGLGTIPDLTDPTFLAQRSDTQLGAAIREGVGPGGTIPGHAFGGALSSLENWDLIQYVRDGVLTVADLFPEAAKFTVKDFTLDARGQARLRDGAGFTLPPEDATVILLTVYGGQKAENGAVELVAWNPVNLDLLDSKQRLGFGLFDDVKLPGETQSAWIGLSVGRDGKIKRLVLKMDDAKRRVEHEKLLASFVGMGDRKPTALKAPRGVKGAEKYEAIVTRLYGRAIEAISLYDQSELDRTMFD